MSRFGVPTILTFAAGFCAFLYLILAPVGIGVKSSGVQLVAAIFMAAFMMIVSAIFYYMINSNK